MTASTQRRLTAGVLLLLGTLWLWLDGGKYDIWITSQFYDATAPLGSRFPVARLEPWHFFNEYNPYFTRFLVGFLAVMLLVGLVRKGYRFMAYYALFGFLTVYSGAGVLVNSLLKGRWGRPRPRLTTLWPDTDQPLGTFAKVWDPVFLTQPELIGKGVSFPSGHVSIVVAYMVLYYIFRNEELWAAKLGKYPRQARPTIRLIKWGSLVFVMLIGLLTGIGRIVAGAHHASDVLWAFGVVWLWTLLLYYAFRIPNLERKVLATATGTSASAGT